MVFCKFCKERLWYDSGFWVDSTDGDGCSGDDDLNNENKPHVPGELVYVDYTGDDGRNDSDVELPAPMKPYWDNEDGGSASK